MRLHDLGWNAPYCWVYGPDDKHTWKCRVWRFFDRLVSFVTRDHDK